MYAKHGDTFLISFSFAISFSRLSCGASQRGRFNARLHLLAFAGRWGRWGHWWPWGRHNWLRRRCPCCPLWMPTSLDHLHLVASPPTTVCYTNAHVIGSALAFFSFLSFLSSFSSFFSFLSFGSFSFFSFLSFFSFSAIAVSFKVELCSFGCGLAA